MEVLFVLWTDIPGVPLLQNILISLVLEFFFILQHFYLSVFPVLFGNHACMCVMSIYIYWACLCSASQF